MVENYETLDETVDALTKLKANLTMVSNKMGNEVLDRANTEDWNQVYKMIRSLMMEIDETVRVCQDCGKKMKEIADIYN